jgi:hypothetical protein
MGAWKGKAGYAQRCGYALALVLSLGLVSAAVAVQELAEQVDAAGAVRTMFVYFSLAQFGLVVLLAAIGTSRSIVMERERDALDLLLLSALPRWAILMAKAGGDVLGIVAVLAAGLPVFSFLSVIGGVSAGEVASTHLILLGTMAGIGGVCVLLGVGSPSSYRVMVVAWLVTAGVLAAPAYGPWLWPGGARLWGIFEAASPLAILSRELSGIDVRWGPSLAVLGGGLGMLAAACLAGGPLLERAQARHREQGTRRSPARLALDLLRGIASPRFLGAVLRPIAPVRNPVVRRECSLALDRGFQLEWILFLAIYLAGVVSASFLGMLIDPWAVHATVVGAGALAVVLLTLVRTALSIHADRRKGALEVFLAMNVEPEDLVRGKILGGLVRALYLLAAPAGHGLVVAAVAEFEWEAAFHVLRGLGATAWGLLFALMLCVRWSIASRSALVAMTLDPVVPLAAGGMVALFMAASLVTFVLGVVVVTPMLFAIYASAVTRFRRNALAR